MTAVGSMREAVAVSADAAVKGDSVLLSPACASFDMFSSYRERGDVFKREVRLANGAE
jgi:UDP-N-acetylmuramoylalanine--D-glutamate ligase